MGSGHTGVGKLAAPPALASFLGETNNTNHPVLFQNPMNGDDSSPAARKRFRILIADDHEAVRRGLRSAVSSAGWDLCGEAVHGKDAVEKVQALNPDLVILDLSMPVMNGLDAAREA